MWLVAYYQPVGLFSLKMGTATSTAGKTLFLPTPFTIRTALLDAAIRTQGLEKAPEVFAMLKTLKIAARPPEEVVVTNLFTKVFKPQRPDAQRDEAMQSSIAFREYAHLGGDLGLAFEGEEQSLQQLEDLLLQINYFGKRGSFFQLIPPLRRSEKMPEGFVLLKGIGYERSEIGDRASFAQPLGVIQVLDDWGPRLTFEKINVYNDTRIELGRDRSQEMVILPYRLERSSRSFSYYVRL
ncbi:hypothetical protein [Ammonifex thiophilus]|uniref:hypothetical protein n=1 Tax=Ammonifex thiophilus TaxID=444093 RepID=UPI00106B3FB8|nr:hypothetical protein [Ammonifex thiophilus]